MITIHDDGQQKYKMTFSAPGTGWKGYSVHAFGLRAVKLAIDHHMANPSHNRGAVKACPLCQMMKAEEKKSKRYFIVAPSGSAPDSDKRHDICETTEKGSFGDIYDQDLFTVVGRRQSLVAAKRYVKSRYGVTRPAVV